MNTTRRSFLATTTGLTLAGAHSYAARAASPNNTINVAIIGCGNQGFWHLNVLQRCPEVRVAAVCDVNAKRMAEARQQAGGEKVFASSDYRKLLERKEIDAVIIATADHWHALPAIHACQAGKDVYVEKPLATSIGEGRAVVRAARKYNRIVQIGTQQRTWPHYIEAINLIRSGALGEISEVKVWDYDYFWPGFGTLPDSELPAELDWEMYLGPSPKVPYNVNRYNGSALSGAQVTAQVKGLGPTFPTHHFFFDLGGGWPVDWGVHHYTIVHAALGVDAPVAATGMGGFFTFEKTNIEWPETFEGILEYPPGPVAKKGFLLQYSSRLGCRREKVSHGKCFYGSEASLLLHRGGYTITPESREKKIAMKGKESSVDNAYAGNVHVESVLAHAKVFLESMRTRKRPPADVEFGHRGTNPGHLLNIAWRVGRKIRWDAGKEVVLDDPEANALVTKSYRAPWKLEV